MESARITVMFFAKTYFPKFVRIWGIFETVKHTLWKITLSAVWVQQYGFNSTGSTVRGLPQDSFANASLIRRNASINRSSAAA